MVARMANAAAGGGLLALVATDSVRAHAAGRRARNAAWQLAIEGWVTIPPVEGPAGPDSLLRAEQRQDYCCEVRAALESKWKTVNPQLRWGDPATYPDPQKLSFSQRIAYTLEDPVEYSEAVAAHSGHLYTSTSEGGPALTVAAFLDPNLRNFHFGADSPRYLRWHVSFLWYLFPALGPPNGTIALHGSAQSWRLMTWPLRRLSGLVPTSLGAARIGTPHIDGSLLGRWCVDNAGRNAKEDISARASDQVLWHIANQIAVLFASDNTADVTASRGATAIWPNSHLVVASALRLAAMERESQGGVERDGTSLSGERSAGVGPLSPSQSAWSAAIAEWGRARVAMAQQPPLRAGWRTLNSGDLVHARVHALESMPPSSGARNSTDTGAPRVIQNAKASVIALGRDTSPAWASSERETIEAVLRAVSLVQASIMFVRPARGAVASSRGSSGVGGA